MITKRLIFYILFISLAGACGRKEDIKEESAEIILDENSGEKKEIEVPINVDLITISDQEKTSGLFLLENLAHEIQISNCISFKEGEVKTVESSISTPTGSINLFLGDTDCEATLVRFRHQGQWFIKAPANEQPPSETETELFKASFGDTSKNFFIKNYSILDKIEDNYSLIKFSVWKSFEKNQEERSIPIGTAAALIDSTFENLELPKFYVESVTKSTANGLQLIFQLRCDTSPSSTDCNGALGTPDNLDFYLFKREDSSEKTYTIDELIAKVVDLTFTQKNAETATISDISAEETNRFTVKFNIEDNYLISGTNYFTFVTATNDAYAPGDYYSKSYRYHVIDLSYSP